MEATIIVAEHGSGTTDIQSARLVTFTNPVLGGTALLMQDRETTKELVLTFSTSTATTFITTLSSIATELPDTVRLI